MIRFELFPRLIVRSELFGTNFAQEAQHDLEDTIRDLEAKVGEYDPLSVYFAFHRQGLGFACLALHPNTRWGRELLKAYLPVESSWSAWKLSMPPYEGERAFALGEKWIAKMRWHTKSSYRRAVSALERRMKSKERRHTGALLDIDLRTALVSVGAGISVAEGLARVEKAFDVWGDGPLTGLGFEKYRDRSTDSLFMLAGASMLAVVAMMGFMR